MRNKIPLIFVLMKKAYLGLFLMLLNLYVFSVDLQGESHFLIVQAKIESAKVFVDGSFIGETDSKGELVIPVSAGTSRLEIKRAGYNTIFTEVIVDELSHKLVIELEKKLFPSSFFFY